MPTTEPQRTVAVHEPIEDVDRRAVSVHRGEVSGHELTRMVSRNGNPTSLGQAIAHLG
ncbi:hypothetical protein [Nocardia sp. NPDC049707]|uniref:hypothetical protein n=1 Tax=Nocardia sp. NPDC049707 TaxID=3154735 RepID=UPI003426265E